MISSLWSSIQPLEQQPLHDDSPQWRIQLKALLVFFTSRIWRGGPRLMLQIAACVFTILLLFQMAPSGFGDDYYSILSWSRHQSQDSGHLRIVVFGSQDLVGSAVDSKKARSTWTEQFCKELNCSALLSFVPSSSSMPALTSNAVYDKEVRDWLVASAEPDATGMIAANYSFIRDQYPVPATAPDLAAQVEHFLSRPRAASPPRETLWVFTFGTWDVWNLAAMPREVTGHIVDNLVKGLFSQIELLYKKSLDSKSPAFSDFWSNTTKEEIDRLTARNTDDKVDERELESFRVVIPELFDISLTPGWLKRHAPPAPHSPAEQMRNAAWLTNRWNSRIKSEMKEWMLKQRSSPYGIEEEDVERVAQVPKTGSLLEYLSAPLRSHHTELEGGDEDENVIYAPYPRRVATTSNPASSILDAMTEEEMQRAGLTDGKGRGTWAADAVMRFQDVWTACVAGSGNIAAADLKQPGGDCKEAGDHLFHDAFTVSQRAINELARTAAEKVQEDLFVRKPQQPSGLTRRSGLNGIVRQALFGA